MRFIPLAERITGIRRLLAAQPRPAHAENLVRRFHRARCGDAQEVLNSLVALGLARRLDDNRYASAPIPILDLLYPDAQILPACSAGALSGGGRTDSHDRTAQVSYALW